jgi:hypothetical protein
MSNPKDAIQEALARNKQLAARLLVHAQDLEAKVKETQSRLALAQEGAPDLAASLHATLDTQRTEMEGAQGEYQAVLQELDALKKLLKDAERGVLVADLGVTLPGDALSASAVDQALARVREHAAHLEAQVEVNRALAPTPAIPTESPEEKARRQLEELKAARNKRTL